MGLKQCRTTLWNNHTNWVIEPNQNIRSLLIAPSQSITPQKRNYYFDFYQLTINWFCPCFYFISMESCMCVCVCVLLFFNIMSLRFIHVVFSIQAHGAPFWEYNAFFYSSFRTFYIISSFVLVCSMLLKLFCFSWCIYVCGPVGVLGRTTPKRCPCPNSQNFEYATLYVKELLRLHIKLRLVISWP